MPIIDTPFDRVAVDLVGPIFRQQKEEIDTSWP